MRDVFKKAIASFLVVSHFSLPLYGDTPAQSRRAQVQTNIQNKAAANPDQAAQMQTLWKDNTTSSISASGTTTYTTTNPYTGRTVTREVDANGNLVSTTVYNAQFDRTTTATMGSNGEISSFSVSSPHSSYTGTQASSGYDLS